MPNRIDSINALLERSKQELESIEQEYNKSLHVQKIEPSLKIDIKNLCENLRSVLDYVANDIRDKYNPLPKSAYSPKFPILPDPILFEKQVRKSFPTLKANCPDLYSYLEAVQPYQSDKTRWLGLFNALTNDNKHSDLVEQTRIETKQVKVTDQDGKSVAWNSNHVTFSPGISILGAPIDPTTRMPKPRPWQTVEVITWVDFRFAGIDTSALGLLKLSLSGINEIASVVQKWL